MNKGTHKTTMLPRCESIDRVLHPDYATRQQQQEMIFDAIDRQLFFYYYY